MLPRGRGHGRPERLAIPAGPGAHRRGQAAGAPGPRGQRRAAHGARAAQRARVPSRPHRRRRLGRHPGGRPRRALDGEPADLGLRRVHGGPVAGVLRPARSLRRRARGDRARGHPPHAPGGGGLPAGAALRAHRRRDERLPGGHEHDHRGRGPGHRLGHAVRDRPHRVLRRGVPGREARTSPGGGAHHVHRLRLRQGRGAGHAAQAARRGDHLHRDLSRGRPGRAGPVVPRAAGGLPGRQPGHALRPADRLLQPAAAGGGAGPGDG